MKALKVITSLLLILTMLAMPLLASEFVPSAERPKFYQIIDWFSETDKNTRKLVIIPMHLRYGKDFIDEEFHDLHPEAADAIEEQIRQSLIGAVTELEDNLIHHLVEGFDEAWARVTGGAPLENHIILDVFEAAWICSEEQAMITDEPVSFTLKIDGIGPDDKFLIVHKPTGSDEWILEDYEIDAEGNVTIHCDKLSPFAIVIDSGKAPAATVTSPQTGVSDYTAAAICMAGILAGLGAICVKKSRRVSAQ